MEKWSLDFFYPINHSDSWKELILAKLYNKVVGLHFFLREMKYSRKFKQKETPMEANVGGEVVELTQIKFNKLFWKQRK